MKRKTIFTTAAAIILFFALIFLSFAVWIYIHHVGEALSDAIEGGMKLSENLYLYMNFCMQEMAPYLAYGLLLAAAGLLLLKREPEKAPAEPPAEIPVPANTETDRELDEWFGGMKENGEKEPEAPVPPEAADNTEPSGEEPAAE
ncbi:MAG: hypothetical protein FWE80_00410 [Oscillospiraceae bacterium]|nr:hypothetical protein [Oscillospiraceae bacterium]